MAKHPFKSPLYPYSNYFCIAFLILVTIGMLYNPDTRMSILSSWVFIAAITAAWFLCGLNKKKYDKEGHLLTTTDEENAVSENSGTMND